MKWPLTVPFNSFPPNFKLVFLKNKKQGGGGGGCNGIKKLGFGKKKVKNRRRLFFLIKQMDFVWKVTRAW